MTRFFESITIDKIRQHRATLDRRDSLLLQQTSNGIPLVSEKVQASVFGSMKANVRRRVAQYMLNVLSLLEKVDLL
jgi:hypothetical protein